MKIVPKLELKKKTDTEFDEYTEDRVEDLTGNVNFPVTDPDIAAVEAKRVLFHNSMVDEPTKAQTQAKNQLREELELMVTNLAYDVAKKSNGNLAIFLSSGFDAKKMPAPAGQPNAPINFILRFTKDEEESKLVAKWKSSENAVNYQIMIGTTPFPPDEPGSTAGGPSSGEPTPGPGPVPANSWWVAGTTTASRLTLTGLTSGTKYYARVRAFGTGSLKSGWSDMANKTCP